jgi:hypothetical protein
MNKKLIYKYGIGTGLAMILYFMLMKFTGLIDTTELRYLNLFIIMGGLYSYLKKTANKNVDYLSAFSSGIFVSLIAVITFVLFFMIYIDIIDPAFYDYIKENEPFGNSLDKTALGFMLIVEGMCSGFILTFVLMQHFKSHLHN